MKKKKKINEQEVMHIKNKTKGTSNEISFSVLNNLKEKNEERKDIKNKEDKALLWTMGDKKPSVFKRLSFVGAKSDHKDVNDISATPQGLHCISGDSSTDSPLVNKRRFARYMRNTVSVALISLLIIALILLSAFGAKSYLDSLRLETNKVTNLIAELEATDEYLLRLDSAVSDSTKHIADEELNYLEDNKKSITNNLSEINNKATQGSEKTTRHENTYLLQSIIDSTTQKAKMVDTGLAVVQEKKKIGDFEVKINGFVQDIAEADAVGKEASLIISEGSPGSFESAKNNDTQAKEGFIDVADSIKIQQEKHSELDFSGFLEYLDLKISAYDNAILSDEALISRNIEDARYYNEIYQDFDSKAASMALNLVQYQDSIIEAFSTDLTQLENEYFSYKANASVADEHIRSYLEEK